MPITLTPEIAGRLRASIKRFVLEQLEQDIGDLKAGLLLDYVLKEVGPVIYNRAIADAQAYFEGRVADLEGVCYEAEFTYWTPPPDGRGAATRKTGRGRVDR
jgi:uncharacterized protein (DUF2164 family)